jgi:SAM-dependent methyltransferase
VISEFLERTLDYLGDFTLGISTRKRLEVESMNIPHHEKVHAQRYQPTPYRELNSILLVLKSMQLENHKFIDYGCGKGRVMCMALKYGFRDVVGYEIDPDLIGCAQKNLTHYSPNSPQIELIHSSAENVKKIDTPMIQYFFNPFSWDLYFKVLAHNLENESQYVVLHNPVYSQKVIELGYDLIREVSLPLSSHRALILSRAGAPKPIGQ